MTGKKLNLSKYKAVVLAGGRGTRLHPVTLHMAKPLLPVGQKPMINHIIDHLQGYGVKNIAVLIAKNHKEDFNWWKKRYYSSQKNGGEITLFEEEEPLGTFGGLWRVKKWLAKSDFFLVNADNLTDLSISGLADFAEKNNFIGTLALVKSKNAKDYGSVLCEGKAVKKFAEKSKSPLSDRINSGWYLMSDNIFDYHPGPVFSMIEKDIFPRLAEEGVIGGLCFDCRWIDCGTWERYEQAIEMFGRSVKKR